MATAQVADRGIDRWARDTVKAAELPGEISYDTHDGQRIVVYRPYERQAEFCSLLDRGRYRLFGGAAGPGKTLTLLMQAVLVANCKDDGRGLGTLCLRRTVPQLEGSFLREFRKHVPRELYQHFNETKKVVTWWNGAITRFGSMQYEKDVWDYAGNEWARVLWDELCQFLFKQWETMRVWNRCPLDGVPVGMDGGANPIGPGALFVKSLFVDKEAPMEMERKEQYNPADYLFVPARVTDNPIYANDVAYLQSLEELPKVLRDAMLLGLWTIAAGAYFDLWDEATMTVREEGVGRELWWPMWLSLDWGFEHHTAVYWHTTSPQGVTTTYRELCVRHTDPIPLAEQILQASVDPKGKRERPKQIYISPDAFHKRTSAASIGEQMNEVFRKAQWPMAGAADTDRVGGWQLMYGMLRAGTWKIGTSCARLIKCLPVLARDEKRVEDIALMPGLDDPADGARYGIYSHLKGTRPPLEQRIAQHITATEVNAQYQQLLVAQAKERSATPGPVRMRRPWMARRWSKN